MDDENKMLHWGWGMLVAVAALSAVLQVAYRTQDKARAKARAEIVRIQQKTAEAEAGFSSLVRPEVLRNVVSGMYPDFVPMGFGKTIAASEIIITSRE